MQVEHSPRWNCNDCILENRAIPDSHDQVGRKGLHPLQTPVTIGVPKRLDRNAPQILYFGEGEIATTAVTECRALDQRKERQIGEGLLSDAQLAPLPRLVRVRAPYLLRQPYTHRVARERRQQEIQGKVTREIAVQAA